MFNPVIKVRAVINTIEAHNAGMPIRIVMLPSVPGNSMRDKLSYCRRELDWLRKALMCEPRGGRNSYGALITSPVNESASFGALFMDPVGWHDMCGHASMGFASIAVQLKMIEVREPTTNVILDTPAGIVRLNVEVHNGVVKRVSLVNVPSFVLREKVVEVKGYGNVTTYLSFGGNFYAVIRLEDLGIKWSVSKLRELVRIAQCIWEEFDGEKFINPLTGVRSELYGVRFAEVVSKKPRKEYGILIFGSPDNPLIDRSPSGTGSSAHLAFLRYVGEIDVNEEVRFLSAIDTEFSGKIIEEGFRGGVKYVVPLISTVNKGGFITGYATWIIDEDDPLGEGFTPINY